MRAWEKTHEGHISFISYLIIFLGILNVASVVLPFLITTLDLPSLTFVPVEFIEAGNAIHAVVGLSLIFLGRMVFHRQRGAWTVILMLLFLSLMASSLSIQKPASMVTFTLTLYMLVWLYHYRDHFTSPSIFRLSPKRTSAVVFSVFMIIYGIVGSKTLGLFFEKPINTWTEAIYFTITTMTTVGYGDYLPISPTSQWFTIILMVFGFTAFLLLIGTMLGPYIEERFQKVVRLVGGIRTERLANHLIICGLSAEAKIILETLKDMKETFVAVCGSDGKYGDLAAMGITIIYGDPSASDVLEKAGIGKARALIASSGDDALNAFITVTARKLNPDLPIVAMASSRENMQKLKDVGANNVISPLVIGAERLLGAALGAEDIICSR